MPPAPDTSDREILITRVIAAPRELVFDAWSDPVHLTNWWGPNGFTTTTLSMDFRAGGAWDHVMHGPDGRDYPNTTVYEEIRRPERIAYSNRGHDGEAPEVKFHCVVTFEDLGAEQTRITMRSIFPTAAARDHAEREYGAVEGGRQLLERLAAQLSQRAQA
jgi:uncharacterized protein YndB with AHSA1/START domain